MFREVRRNKKQILSQEKCKTILNESTSGVLSVLGDDDYPYGVPLSHTYMDNKLYFHCARIGHKLDSIKKHDKVSFTVIETDQVVPEEFTTYYRSVIAFGKVHIVDEDEQKKEILMNIARKYSSGFIKGAPAEIEKSLKAVEIFYVEIEHLSGKEAIEFAER